MTNYNNLTQEQKESINHKLRELFEGCKEWQDLNKVDFPFCGVTAITSKNYETELCDKCKGKIKGFQEGLKTAIKIIDEEIEFLGGKINVEKMTIDTTSLQINIVSNSYDDYAHKCFDYEPIIKMIKIRIEELKKQREQIQLEVELK